MTAIDGTLVCCPDTAANLAVYRRGCGCQGGTGYPLVPVLARLERPPCPVDGERARRDVRGLRHGGPERRSEVGWWPAGSSLQDMTAGEVKA